MSRASSLLRPALAPLLATLLATVTAGAAVAQPRPPFVIAPVVEGLLECGLADDGTAPDSYCAAASGRAGVALRQLLDELEPGGPRGDVQVGYVLTVQLLALYRRQAEGWVVDEGRLARVAQLVAEVDRPVVIYLAANHFDSRGPLPEALAQDGRNLMAGPGGQPLALDYFGYPVRPWTLATDASVPVNRYRFEALALLARRIAALPAPLQQRVVGVALGGELHHLFEDFSAGMGAFRGVRGTDYSPMSQRAFREWLARRHGSIARLNAFAGTSYGSFAEIAAPGSDATIASQEVAQRVQDDDLAGGMLPVHGWLWDPEQRVQRLELRVDGRPLGVVPRGFNRLDVYRAKAEVTDPNVGFRYDVDFSTWRPGTYRLQLVARTPDGEVQLAVRHLHVEGAQAPSRIARGWARLVARANRLWAGGPGPGTVGAMALDFPPEGLRVRFNPLAREWNEFRNWQVRAFMEKLASVAQEAGLPRDKLYGHQILPRVNSSWNADLFAADASLEPPAPWRQGINLYGGGASGSWIERHVQTRRITGYGVPEFHPQQWKRPQVHREALELHWRLGARFVSPYYMSITASRGTAADQAVKALEIRPANTRDGSNHLYEAIRALAAR